jgi:hypothetical protein
LYLLRPIFLALIAVFACLAADVCPHPPATSEWNSWTAKIGRRNCLANAVSAKAAVEWPAAGIDQVKVADRLEFAVCCFSKEKAAPAPLRIAGQERQVATHAEVTHHAEDDDVDFPDLIEDDAHMRSASVRGTLGDPEHPVHVDIQLRCSASKFADQFAMQFTVIDRSADPVEVSWDHMRELEQRIHPSVQPVSGGKTWVFLTKSKPAEAVATVELKSRAGELLGRFHFDGWK